MEMAFFSSPAAGGGQGWEVSMNGKRLEEVIHPIHLLQMDRWGWPARGTLETCTKKHKPPSWIAGLISATVVISRVNFLVYLLPKLKGMTPADTLAICQGHLRHQIPSYICCEQTSAHLFHTAHLRPVGEKKQLDGTS